MATTTCIQDRTSEFCSILHQAQRRQTQGKIGSQRQSLLSASEKQNASAAPTRKQRSEFARRAAEVGRGIGATMSKLERLAQLAKRKTLFDDRPEEINQLTFVIKQDLAQLNSNISQLESINKQQHPGVASAKQSSGTGPNDDQEGFHNKNVLTLLQSKLGAVGMDFKDVLEVRTKNIQASQDRQRNFVSSVSQAANPATLDPSRTDSPLYQTPQRGRSPKPGYANTAAAQQDLLSIEPTGSSALTRAGPQSDQQMLMMEEGNQSYIQGRGEAIESIERTISELGGIFGQLAQMVSEQTEMIQRIDANTEDVVDNVQGAQRELMKYWTRVSGNRWLVAKMFGVLMIFFLLWVLVAG